MGWRSALHGFVCGSLQPFVSTATHCLQRLTRQETAVATAGGRWASDAEAAYETMVLLTCVEVEAAPDRHWAVTNRDGSRSHKAEVRKQALQRTVRPVMQALGIERYPLCGTKGISIARQEQAAAKGDCGAALADARMVLSVLVDNLSPGSIADVPFVVILQQLMKKVEELTFPSSRTSGRARLPRRERFQPRRRPQSGGAGGNGRVGGTCAGSWYSRGSYRVFPGV